MSLLNHRIGRLGFALGYLPVIALIVALTWDAPNHRWYVGAELDRIVLFAAVLLWSICLSAWRCHDFGKSAWFDFWNSQVPFFGPLVSLWDLFVTPGEPHANAYGPVPKLQADIGNGAIQDGQVRLKRSKLTARQTLLLCEHFVAGAPARTAVQIVGVNRNTAILF